MAGLSVSGVVVDFGGGAELDFAFLRGAARTGAAQRAATNTRRRTLFKQTMVFLR